MKGQEEAEQGTRKNIQFHSEWRMSAFFSGISPLLILSLEFLSWIRLFIISFIYLFIIPLFLINFSK